MYGEYVDEDLPLPPFREVFAFALRPPIQSSANLNRKRAYSKSNNQLSFLGSDSFDNDHKQSKSKKQKDTNAEESTGRWSAEEHKLFLQGIMLYGKDWKKMQPLIKTRSLVQIRTHAQKVFKKIGLKKLETHSNGGLGSNDPSMKQLQDYLQKSGATSSSSMTVTSSNIITNHNNNGIQSSSSGIKTNQYESKDPMRSNLQLNASNLSSNHTAASSSLKSPTAMSSSSGVSDGSKAQQAQSSLGVTSMTNSQSQLRIGVQVREESSAMKSFYQNTVNTSSSQQTTNTIPNSQLPITTTTASSSTSNNNNNNNNNAGNNNINNNTIPSSSSSSFYNIPLSSRSSSQYSPLERNTSINNNTNNNNTNNNNNNNHNNNHNNNNNSNNNNSKLESIQVPPSPLPSDYLQMIHGTPVSEEDLRLLQQLSDMKEILNDDDDENPDDEDDLGDDEDQPHHLYSKSISYDAEDGGGRGHVSHHSFHPNSSFSSYLNSSSSSHHQQQLPPQHGYSMISNYPNHLGMDGSHSSMLPSYGQGNSNEGTGGWSAADYLNNDATHLSAGSMSASEIYSHLSNMTSHHNGYDNNPASFYSSSSNNTNNNSQQLSGQHHLYHSSSLLPSVAGGTNLTDSGGLDTNYLIALQSDHSNASYDTAADVHQSAHFLQFLQNSNGMSQHHHHQRRDIQSTEMIGGSRDDEEEEEDEEMRGDDADPIIALANRYSMIPHHSPMSSGNSKNR